jgi:GxxExxY protein
MLEGAYEACLLYELVQAGLKAERQKKLPIIYQGVKIDAGYRLDLLVEDSVIVEIKAIERVLPVHEAQLLSYLRLTNLKLGLLINFNVRLLRDGIRRVVNNFEDFNAEIADKKNFQRRDRRVRREEKTRDSF